MIVYQITNLLTGERYVGQTINKLRDRWMGHCNKNSYCSRLRNAIQKYGKESFSLDILCECNSIDELNIKEEYFISLFNTLSPGGYNLTSGGNNRKMSEETRKKMVGRKVSIENKIKLSLLHSNNKHALGNRLSEETKRKMSIAKLGEKNWAYGKIRHPEHRRKLSLAAKSRKFSEETKSKMSLAHKGNKYSLGHCYSEETKKLKSTLTLHKVPVICHENGKIYESITAAAKDLGLLKKRITDILSGRKKRHKGFTFSKVIKVEQNNGL